MQIRSCNTTWRKPVAVLGAFWLSLALAFAQSKTISGVVQDGAGEPLIGATVIISGSHIQDMEGAAITDLDGQFTLSVPEGAVLEISCLGFSPTKEKVDGRARYVIVLHEDAQVLEDVVVVGYGQQRKESVVGAISQVKGSTLVDSGLSNITDAMSGKLSGVTTLQSSGQPGENDAEIFIRGVSSFNNSSPLVLVDGVERDFTSIDPNEVANISVLKDASATAVFGAKGANGVIIVTTKSGQEGKPKMDFSYSSGFSMPINVPKHIDSLQLKT